MDPRPLREFQDALIAHRVVARVVLAKEFPSDKAKRQYLREHPQADPRNHTVVRVPRKDRAKGDESESGSKKAPDKGESVGEKVKEEVHDVKNKLEGLGRAVGKFLGKVPGAVKKFVQDPKSRKEHLSSAASAIKKAPGKIAREAIKHVKHEAHEFKMAGEGIKLLVTGKELTEKHKSALRTVAVDVAITVAVTALSGGLAAGAAGMAKKTAVSFVTALAKKVALNAVSDGMLGNLTTVQEVMHGVHGGAELFHHLLKVSADEIDTDELLAVWVEASVAKAIEDLGDDEVQEALKEAAGSDTDEDGE
jgi:hypothetical protein